MKIFIMELAKEEGMCSDTIINKIAKQAKFIYFHNEFDCHHIVKSSSEIAKFDKRFARYPANYKKADAIFASDAPFVRGCIAISSS